MLTAFDFGWRILISLLTWAIVIAMLEATSSTFETMVVSILVYILLTVQWGFAANFRNRVGMFIPDSDLLLRLLEKTDPDYSKHKRQELDEVIEQFKTSTKYYIANGIITGLIALTTLYYLYVAIVSK